MSPVIVPVTVLKHWTSSTDKPNPNVFDQFSFSVSATSRCAPIHYIHIFFNVSCYNYFPKFLLFGHGIVTPVQSFRSSCTCCRIFVIINIGFTKRMSMEILFQKHNHKLSNILLVRRNDSAFRETLIAY
jgi:hypothetical protein